MQQGEGSLEQRSQSGIYFSHELGGRCKEQLTVGDLTDKCDLSGSIDLQSVVVDGQRFPIDFMHQIHAHLAADHQRAPVPHEGGTVDGAPLRSRHF